ncbi:MAG TPA: amidase [Oligoflexia bacterium]|nr:amidase [Oligoflexia bacterium]HMP48506.1 amidase [Oligoflexia bacterium]
MIRLIKNTENLLSSFEKKIALLKSTDHLISFYKDFITRYKALDAEFKFTEYFDEEYVFQQLRRDFGESSCPLRALPIGIKDVFNTRVLPTSMGSELWKGFRAGNNARIVDQIINNGGIVFSKTTTAEFAVHFISPEKTLNPYNKNHITGTSSSGSAVAVACGALPVALGTQTAGSIIRPASFCGVYGFKPSFGAIDRTGVLKTNDTFDTIGFLGSDSKGLAKMLLACLTKGKDYPYSNNYFSFFNSYKRKNTTDLKVGFVTDCFQGFSSYSDYVKNDFNEVAGKISKNFNAQYLSNVSFINSIHAIHELMYAKSLSYYFKNEMRQHDHVSEVMTAMIRRGEKHSEKEYIEASKKQPVLRKDFDLAFEKYDFLITPSTATAAPLIGEWEQPDTCLIWTFFGYPAINIPLFFNPELNLPYGLQIVAKKFDDFSLLDFADRVEKLFV